MNIKNNWNSKDFLISLKESSLNEFVDFELKQLNENKLIIKINSFNAANIIGKESNPIGHTKAYNHYKHTCYTNTDHVNNNIYYVFDFNKSFTNKKSLSILISDNNNKIERILYEPGDTYFDNCYEIDDYQSYLNEIIENKMELKNLPSKYEEHWTMEGYINKLNVSSLVEGFDYNVVQNKDNQLSIELLSDAAAFELSTDKGFFKAKKSLRDYKIKVKDLSEKYLLIMDFNKKYYDNDSTTTVLIGREDYVMDSYGRNGISTSETKNIFGEKRLHELNKHLSSIIDIPTIENIERLSKNKKYNFIDLEKNEDISDVFYSLKKVDILLDVDYIKESFNIKTPSFFSSLPKEQKQIRLSDFPIMKHKIHSEIFNDDNSMYLLHKFSDDNIHNILSTPGILKKIIESKSIKNIHLLPINKSVISAIKSSSEYLKVIENDNFEYNNIDHELDNIIFNNNHKQIFKKDFPELKIKHKIKHKKIIE